MAKLKEGSVIKKSSGDELIATEKYVDDEILDISLTPGPKGEDGRTWHVGTTTPSNATGVIGDLYLNRSTWIVYEKTGATTWTNRGNIKGDTGVAGSDGKTWYSGSEAPSNATGVIGDFYLRTSDWTIYKKTGAAAWTSEGSIKGADGGQGIPGTDGTKGDTGDTWKPAVSAAGDLTWTKDSGATTPTARNIKGPQGNVGATGDTWKPTVDASGNLTWSKDSGSTTPTAQNIKGPQGNVGNTGAPGTNGKTWLSGTSNPTNATGTIGDFYLNRDTWTVFEKTGASTWTNRGVIKGEDGYTPVKGVDYFDGETGTKGEDGETGATGKSIEFDWDGTQLGVKVEGDANYSYVDLKGAKGEDGAAGTPGKDATRSPKTMYPDYYTVAIAGGQWTADDVDELLVDGAAFKNFINNFSGDNLYLAEGVYEYTDSTTPLSLSHITIKGAMDEVEGEPSTIVISNRKVTAQHVNFDTIFIVSNTTDLTGLEVPDYNSLTMTTSAYLVEGAGGDVYLGRDGFIKLEGSGFGGNWEGDTKLTIDSPGTTRITDCAFFHLQLDVKANSLRFVGNKIFEERLAKLTGNHMLIKDNDFQEVDFVGSDMIVKDNKMELRNSGGVSINSNRLMFTHNDITIKSSVELGEMDEFEAVHFQQSKDAIITNNTLKVAGNSFTYMNSPYVMGFAGYSMDYTVFDGNIIDLGTINVSVEECIGIAVNKEGTITNNILNFSGSQADLAWKSGYFGANNIVASGNMLNGVAFDPQPMVVINHGANANTPRPSNAMAVYWVGTVEPNNATDNDLWIGGD